MGKFISGCEKYPKELLEGRQTIEGSVIACIAKDLLLLDECGLTVNDFITGRHILFCIAQTHTSAGYCSLR